LDTGKEGDREWGGEGMRSKLGPCPAGTKGADSGGNGGQIRRPFHSDVRNLRMDDGFIRLVNQRGDYP
jgi:hypothetical protein